MSSKTPLNLAVDRLVGASHEFYRAYLEQMPVEQQKRISAVLNEHAGALVLTATSNPGTIRLGMIDPSTNCIEHLATINPVWEGRNQKVSLN